jgi:hypothetical protein
LFGFHWTLPENTAKNAILSSIPLKQRPEVSQSSKAAESFLNIMTIEIITSTGQQIGSVIEVYHDFEKVKGNVHTKYRYATLRYDGSFAGLANY